MSDAEPVPESIEEATSQVNEVNEVNEVNGKNAQVEDKKSKKPKKDDKPKKPEKYKATLVQGPTIYEAVEFVKLPTFLSYTKGGGWKLVDKIETECEIIIPVNKNLVPYKMYQLDLNTWRELRDNPNFRIDKQDVYDEIFDKIDLFLDMDHEFKTLIAVEPFETYQQHKFSAIGYIFVQGGFNSGKTRVCDLLALLTYRPLYGTDMHAANVYSYIGSDEEDEGTQTIIEDEVDWQKRGEELDEKLRIYRTGYRRGAKVLRILNAGTSDRCLRYYYNFCSKIFTGYVFPKDEAFKSRCNTIPSSKGTPQKDELEESDKPGFYEIGLKLLIWRMQTYFEPLPVREMKLQGREKEVWKCKILSAADLSAEEVVTQLAYQTAKEKFEEQHSHLESLAIQAVLDWGEEFEWKEIPFKAIFNLILKDLGVTEFEVDEGSISIPDLNYPLSKSAVGRVLHSILHGKPNLRKGIGRTYLFEKNTVCRLAKSYGIKRRELLPDVTS